MLKYNQPLSKSQWTIRLLQKRNSRIKAEIQNCRIAILQEKKMPKQLRKPSFTSFKQKEFTPEALNLYRKQLQNSYQHIKRFQTELRQQNGRQDQPKKELKYIQLLRQRKSMRPKIMQQIRKEQLKIRQNSRSLSKNAEKGDDKLLQQAKQIQVLKKNLKSIQQENLRKENQLKKQYLFIKRLQKQLLNEGMEPQQLQKIMAKSIEFLNPITKITTIPSNQTQNSFQQILKQKIFRSIPSSPNKGSRLIPSSPNKDSRLRDSSLSQSRTKINMRLISEKTVYIGKESGNYNRNIKKDVELLQKIISEDQQTISRLQKQIYHKKYENIKTKNAIKDIDLEISKYQKVIFELQKKQVN